MRRQLALVVALPLLLLAGQASAQSDVRCRTVKIEATPALFASLALGTIANKVSALGIESAKPEEQADLVVHVVAKGAKYEATVRAWADPQPDPIASRNRPTRYDALANGDVMQELPQAQRAAFVEGIVARLKNLHETHDLGIKLTSNPAGATVVVEDPPGVRVPSGRMTTPTTLGCLSAVKLGGRVLFPDGVANPFALTAQRPAVHHAVDRGPVDAGPVDAGSVDAGSVDAGSVDAGSVDAGSDTETPPEKPWEPPDWLLEALGVLAMALLLVAGARLFPRTYRPRIEATLLKAKFKEGVCVDLQLALANTNTRVQDIPSMTVVVAPVRPAGDKRKDAKHQESRDGLPTVVSVRRETLDKWALRDGDRVVVRTSGRYSPSILPFTLRFESTPKEVPLSAPDDGAT